MALYNELRSKNFSEIKGQEKPVSIIKGILKTGRIPNALLFVGDRGIGKTSIARIFSRAVNCEHPTEDGPCNECPACREALTETSIDIYELDAASNNSVADIHELIKSTAYTPIRNYKVFIVDEIHMLSTAAFNALLKVVEEPSPNCIFVFCTTEEHKIPVTIKSRCMTVTFEAIDEAVILAYLKEICEMKNKEYESDALCLIARSANGGMRDALSILEPFLSTKLTVEYVLEVLGNPREDMLFSCIFGMVRGDIMESIEAFQAIKKTGKNMKLLTKNMIEAFGDAAYVEAGGSVEKIINTSYYKAFITTLAGELNSGEAQRYIERLCEVYAASKYTTINFALECAILELSGKKKEEIDVSSRLVALEQEVKRLKMCLSTKNYENIVSDMTETILDNQEGEEEILEEYKEEIVEELKEEEEPLPSEESTPFLAENNPFLYSDYEGEEEKIPLDMPANSFSDEESADATDIIKASVDDEIGGEVVGTISMSELLEETAEEESVSGEVKKVEVKNAKQKSVKEEKVKATATVPSFWGFARRT